jgi:hypothetical protein
MRIIICYWKIHNISEPCYLSCNLKYLINQLFLDARQLALAPWFWESILIFAHWEITKVYLKSIK